MKINKNNNAYIIAYATILVVVVAAVLSFASISLKPAQQANVEVEKMGAILSSIGEGKDAATAPEGKDKYIKAQYAKYIIGSFCVNAMGEKVDGDAFASLDDLKAVFAAKKAMPIFEAQRANGEKLYVIPITGAGLWGPVWGYIALGPDCSTVVGAVFDHKGETPGLGAEISTPAFSDQFLLNKQLFNGDKFESIKLTKGAGSSEGNPYAVDAISGGTLTSNGVSAMLKNCLGDYAPFFEKIRAENAMAQMPAQDTMAVVADSVAIVE